MNGYSILGAINACFYVYYIMIVARCLLSFFPNLDYQNPIIKGLIDSVDIYLNLFRKFIPPVGMFDLSPIVAFVVLMVIKYVVILGLAFIFSLVGLL